MRYPESAVSCKNLPGITFPDTIKKKLPSRKNIFEKTS